MSLEDREYARLHRMDPETPRHALKSRYWIVVMVFIFLGVFVLVSWPTEIFKSSTPWGHTLHSVITYVQREFHINTSAYDAAEKKALSQ